MSLYQLYLSANVAHIFVQSLLNVYDTFQNIIFIIQNFYVVILSRVQFFYNTSLYFLHNFFNVFQFQKLLDKIH